MSRSNRIKQIIKMAQEGQVPLPFSPTTVIVTESTRMDETVEFAANVINPTEIMTESTRMNEPVEFSPNVVNPTEIVSESTRMDETTELLLNVRNPTEIMTEPIGMDEPTELSLNALNVVNHTKIVSDSGGINVNSELIGKKYNYFSLFIYFIIH